MPEQKVLTENDLEKICELAEEVMKALCCAGGFNSYDEDGECLIDRPEKEGRQTVNHQAAGQQTVTECWNYISLARDKDFRQTVLPELQEQPIETIKGRYLSGFLRKARNVLRKGRVNPDFVLSDEIPDSRLDEIFAFTWLGKVRLYTSLCEFVERHGTKKEEP